MIEKAVNYIAKKVAFRTVDAFIPGLGYTLEKCSRAMSVANMLGSRATPERVENVLDVMDDAGDFAKETVRNVLEWVLESDS